MLLYWYKLFYYFLCNDFLKLEKPFFGIPNLSNDILGDRKSHLNKIELSLEKID
jgi:hypothetical protein